MANKNSKYGGNTLIALLPKIQPPHGEKDNPRWPSFAREVFHRAMECVLEPFILPSKDGVAIHCGDGQTRSLVPWLAMANTDLEEAFMYVGHRGVNALYPCPRCKIPHEEQSLFHPTLDLRTQEETKCAIEDALLLQENVRKSASSNLLKSMSLYGIKNSWWKLSRCDVFKALSFDILHSIWSGIWGKHLWLLLLEAIDAKDHSKLNYRACTAPSFPSLAIIPQIAKPDFADGKKYWSILQQILPLIHDLLPSRYLPFLNLIRIIAHITIYSLFKTQTISRIKRGHALVQEFFTALQPVKQLFPKKDFDFIKLHQLLHLFHDIEDKGPWEWLSTITGENLHQGLILAYESSNKKNVGYQIVRSENRSMALSRIRFRLEARQLLKEIEAASMELGGDDTVDPVTAKGITDTLEGLALLKTKHILSGVERKFAHSCDIEEMGGYFEGWKGREWFNGFHSKLIASLQHQYQQSQAEDEPLREFPLDSVPLRIYRTFEHEYYSCDNGTPCVDLIRCSPNFFHKIRFDTVLVQVSEGTQPARLHLIFRIEAYNQIWELAFVTFFTLLPQSPIDKVIGMNRYQEAMIGEFISLDAVIRSCYMVPIDQGIRQFYLNPLAAADLDLFLRTSPIQ
ncbi:hypothetical protein CPB86DRAFT_766272 [Serendipita vermifera]|nr:hypothetical protein CPB86DRAFT_766272 [Serendipita vermifera]